MDVEAGEGPRRAALARWLTDKRNPLTWRSIVNRVWQYHSAAASSIRRTTSAEWVRCRRIPSCSIGSPPSFATGRNRSKQLHRLICTSAVYRQSSAGNPEFEQSDAGESIPMANEPPQARGRSGPRFGLAVAGKLNPMPGGPVFMRSDSATIIRRTTNTTSTIPNDPLSHRRSIYRLIVRSVPDPFMTTLDCADSSASVAKRNETITPLQSLALLNNKFMVRMAEHLPRELSRWASNNSERITAAWRLAFARDPSGSELSTMTNYAERHGLANACRLIFNMNEFVFID